MKKILYTTALVSVALFLGCVRSGEPDGGKTQGRQVRVELSGALTRPGATRVTGMVNPVLDDPANDLRGLPPEQLGIGIMTVELTESDMTDATLWDNETTYLDRGFFGGVIPNQTAPVTDGNIEYTTRDGGALQQVFYDEMGIYYYIVCAYPYDAMVIRLDDNGNIMMNDMRDPAKGVTISFEIDGSQDVMASTMGTGNIDNPFTSVLTFSHKLTSLRCKFVAETAVAKDLYGGITSVELIDQPDVVGLNVGANALDPTTALTDERTSTIHYPAVSSYSATTPLPLPSVYSTDPGYTAANDVEFGYMLAMPALKYTFRIMTEKRGPLYATYNFSTTPAAGTIYNLTFKMLESAEIMLTAAPADDYWLDQTYD